MEERLVMIIIAVIVFTSLGLFVLYLKQNSKIWSLRLAREKAFILFKRAKQEAHTEVGKEKMNWVISQIRLLIPKPFNFFINDFIIRALLQKWFNEIEDYLDDGKFNDTEEGWDIK